MASVMLCCLISGNDSRPKPSSRRSDGVHLAPRTAAKIKTPGAITGLVLGIMFVVLAIGAVIWLCCIHHLSTPRPRNYDREEFFYRRASSGHRWRRDIIIPGAMASNSVSEADSRETRMGSTDERVLGGVVYEIADESPHRRLSPHKPEVDDTYEMAILPIPAKSSELALNEMMPNNKAGPPSQFWIPTKMERDIASELSVKKVPSIAVPPPAHARPRAGSEDGLSSECPTPTFRSKIFLAAHPLYLKMESLTPE
jgi:hypothetical protein